MLLVRGMIQIWDGIAITLVKVKDNDMCVVAKKESIGTNKQARNLDGAKTVTLAIMRNDVRWNSCG